MLLQWLTRISLVIIVFVIWYPISRHFLRTVLFWDNRCIYDYHNWSLCLDMLEWKQKVILRFHLLFVYIYLCYKCNPLFHHLMKVIPWYVLLLINTKTKKEFILKNNIFFFLLKISYDGNAMVFRSFWRWVWFYYAFSRLLLTQVKVR